MTSAVLAGLLIRQPFRSFAFHVGDTDVLVTRAEQVRHKPGDRIITVLGITGDREHIIDLDRVAMISVSPSKGS